MCGPWTPDLGGVERTARLRALRALVLVFAGPGHPLLDRLARAERDPACDDEAQALLDALPSLTRRRVWSAFARLHRPQREVR